MPLSWFLFLTVVCSPWFPLSNHANAVSKDHLGALLQQLLSLRITFIVLRGWRWLSPRLCQSEGRRGEKYYFCLSYNLLRTTMQDCIIWFKGKWLISGVVYFAQAIGLIFGVAQLGFCNPRNNKAQAISKNLQALTCILYFVKWNSPAAEPPP